MKIKFHVLNTKGEVINSLKMGEPRLLNTKNFVSIKNPVNEKNRLLSYLMIGKMKNGVKIK